MKRAAVAGAYFIALVGLWGVAAESGLWSPVILPPPWSVAAYLLGATADGTFLVAMMVTLRHLLVGYAIGLLADRILFSPWERFLHSRWGANVKEA